MPHKIALRLPAPSESGPEILDVGFGTSEIPSSLFHDGYHFVTAIDVSAESVRLAQQRRSSEQKSLQFLQMNATRMSFPDECFHAVFDKATLDTLLCSHQGAAEAYLSEVFRVLQPGGIFLLISHSGPAERLPYLLRLNSAQEWCLLGVFWRSARYGSGLEEAIRPWKVQVAQLPKSDGGDLDPHEGEDDRANSCFWLFLCTKPPVNSESF
eukprot:g13044.t1